MAVNVRAPFVAVQALQPSMPNGGRIINIGSCLAERARAGVTIYAASKSALLGLTRGWRATWDRAASPSMWSRGRSTPT